MIGSVAGVRGNFVQSPAEVGYARAPSWPISDDYTHDIPVSARSCACARTQARSSEHSTRLPRFAAPASPPSLGPPTQCGSASVGLCARCGSGPSPHLATTAGRASLLLVSWRVGLTADRTYDLSKMNEAHSSRVPREPSQEGRYARPRGSARAARARASASPRALQRCGQGARAGSLLSPQLCLNLRQHSISHECDQHFL